MVDPGYTRDNPFALAFGAMVRRSSYGEPTPRSPREAALAPVRQIFDVRGNLLLYRVQIWQEEQRLASDARMRRSGLSGPMALPAPPPSPKGRLASWLRNLRRKLSWIG